jgi:hypothetical protein
MADCQLTAGSSLAGTTSTDILQNITHRVGLTLESNNYTKWPLVNPIAIVNAGQIKTAPVDVHPGSREVMSMHKTDHTATGLFLDLPIQSILGNSINFIFLLDKTL